MIGRESRMLDDGDPMRTGRGDVLAGRANRGGAGDKSDHDRHDNGSDQLAAGGRADFAEVQAQRRTVLIRKVDLFHIRAPVLLSLYDGDETGPMWSAPHVVRGRLEEPRTETRKSRSGSEGRGASSAAM